MSNSINDKPNEPEKPVEASFAPNPDASFVREKIKAKPINRTKLIRKTLFTALTAAVFGAVACVTFLLLEPVISEHLVSSNVNSEPGEQATTVVLPEIVDEPSDEMLPEDMIMTDRDYLSEAIQGDVSEVSKNVRNIEEMIKSIEFGIGDYQNLYTELRTLAEDVSNSIVTVHGLSEGTDLLNDSYEYGAQVSGVIVADNGVYLLILVKDSGLTSADELRVVFADGTTTDCEIIGRDETTGLLILGVHKFSLTESSLEMARPASLGTSRSATLKGTPVIALGSPIGIADSFAYGMVTSGTQQLYMTDSDYTLITTDILGTGQSSGVLVNLRGNVIGLIDNSYESGTAEGVVNAVGITELKPLIESLSNGTERAFLGIQGMDISYSMRNSYGLPEGIYLRAVELDSPAMEAGIQTGDILIAVNGEAVINYHDFILWLTGSKPGTTVPMTLMRQSVDEYIEVNVEVTLGTLEVPERE